MLVTAAMVKDLRERTGAGMMECKKALTEHEGDLDAAVEALRKKGAASADKKAGRIAAEGVIALAGDNRSAALVEVNCETDFVAKEDTFKAFAQSVAECVLARRPRDIDELISLPLEQGSVDEVRRELVAKIGEKIDVRRFTVVDAESEGVLGRYVHGSRLGVVVSIEGSDEVLGKDLAMHVAASKPLCISAAEVPEATLASEKEIYRAQALDSGKPENIVEKIIEGRVRKYLNEVTLLGQPYVKDSDMTVDKLIKQAKTKIVSFVRLEVGEGIERREDDFVAEVMAQAKKD